MKETWIKGKDYPIWMDDASLQTLSKGYLLGTETPKEAIDAIGEKVGRYAGNEKIGKKVSQYIWNGWICPSTPIWSNFRHKRAASISCFGSYIGDEIDNIGYTLSEVMKMTQIGGGTSAYWGEIRPRGSKIQGGGETNGSVSFMEIFDTMINKVSQGGIRRGATAMYLPITHGDIEEFLNIKDAGNPIQNLFTGVTIPNSFIDKVYEGDYYALKIWAQLLKSRVEKGMPYIVFSDNMNNHTSTPNWYGYKQHNPDYQIVASNLCSEIALPSNSEESFVCCVSSMNIAKYDEWKDTDAVEMMVWLLDAVVEDFIQKTKNNKLMKRAHNFAVRHRALGIGGLGLHSYYQSKNLPFVSLTSSILNKQIFKNIQEKAEQASLKIGKLKGACKIGDGKRRNSTLTAIAPTVSNATIQGGVSPGIEPLSSNYFVQKSAKGKFIRRNVYLEQLLEKLEKNTEEVWKSIDEKGGSVQHLSFLSQEDKEVFKTFSEINQFGIIEQCADRQMYICQSQSLNLSVPPDTEPKMLSKLYLYAHNKGVKSLYYQRSQSILEGIKSLDSSCLFCEG